MKTLEIKTTIQISRPCHEVFEAIVDPAKISGYFIAKSTGRLEEGRTVTWQFPEFPDEVPVRGGRIEAGKIVSFYWANEEGKDLLVEMNLEETPENNTIVRVTEKSMENNEAGIKWLKGNTEGWAYFLACLKAYLEYGINLRKGAFDYLSKPEGGKNAG